MIFQALECKDIMQCPETVAAFPQADKP